MKRQDFEKVFINTYHFSLRMISNEDETSIKDFAITLSELNQLHNSYIKEIKEFTLYPKYEMHSIPGKQQDIKAYCENKGIHCSIIEFNTRQDIMEVRYPVIYKYKGIDITALIEA